MEGQEGSKSMTKPDDLGRTGRVLHYTKNLSTLVDSLVGLSQPRSSSGAVLMPNHQGVRLCTIHTCSLAT
jgi:hypothetical protein